MTTPAKTKNINRRTELNATVLGSASTIGAFAGERVDRTIHKSAARAQNFRLVFLDLQNPFIP
jgi:hypothetical protein